MRSGGQCCKICSRTALPSTLVTTLYQIKSIRSHQIKTSLSVMFSSHTFQDLNSETMIAATNGTSAPAMTIFSHALRFFKEHALQELSDQSATRILNEDVKWVITVPAIWKAPAKQFMRAAAYNVSIYSVNITTIEILSQWFLQG